MGAVLSKAYLSWGNEELVKLHRTSGCKDRVVLWVIEDVNSAEAMRVCDGSSFVPSGGKVSKSNGNGSDVPYGLLSTQLFVKLDIFGDLRYVYGGMNGICRVAHQVFSW